VSALAALLGRELSLAWGRGGGPLLACAFYLCIAALLPLAVGPDPERLAAIAPGAAWLALGLSALLSLERLFERDLEDGALDLLALGPAPLELVAAAKCLAQWLATGLPLALLAPLVAAMLGAGLAQAPLTLVAATLGGLAFAFTGGVGAALAAGSRRGGLLIAVIVLPLYAPPVIFGAGALQAAADGLLWIPALSLLGAYALAAAALGPLAMAAAVRNAIE
jgi:heme exporter protein B